VAAVNGHAIAGGLILSAAADWTVMAKGPGRAGVTELLVGVPFPAVALELLRLRAGDAQARLLAVSGATFGAGEALARGLVDEAVSAAELADRSLAAAQRLAALGPAFGLTKRQLRQQFLARVHDLAVLDAEVDAIWKAPLRRIPALPLRDGCAGFARRAMLSAMITGTASRHTRTGDPVLS
jgi:enoyl-CoA hydratase